LKVFLAGRIAVEAQGVVIDERHFPGRQGRLLFAYLVAEHGRAVPRDELAEVLWGDAPPATWEKALSVLVSKLRGVLAEIGVDGASALTATFGCYRLDLPEGAWVDVLAAESAANDADRFLGTDELESAAGAAALAESVTRRPFLPGDDGPWLDEKRRDLAEVRARALSALAEASLRTAKPAEAVRWAELAVEAEPFRETGYRRLMEAHVAAGNRAEALRVYERCRRLLVEELGAYPSPETDAVYRSLLEASSGRATAETEATTSPPGTAPPPPGAPQASAVRGRRALRARPARRSWYRVRSRSHAQLQINRLIRRAAADPGRSGAAQIASLERRSLLGPVPGSDQYRTDSVRRRHADVPGQSLEAAVEKLAQRDRHLRSRAPRRAVRGRRFPPRVQA